LAQAEKEEVAAQRAAAAAARKMEDKAARKALKKQVGEFSEQANWCPCDKLHLLFASSQICRCTRVRALSVVPVNDWIEPFRAQFLICTLI